MAIFGKLSDVESQLDMQKFLEALKYLKKVISEGSLENKRLLSLDLNSFERIELNTNNFALEQVYNTKDRNDCFFESHKKYIDVQFILEGEEIIEVDNIKNLEVNFIYDMDMDLIKYNDSKFSSIIKLGKGDLAIFFPEDAHMPCVKIRESKKVVKTVVKVQID